MQEEYKKPKTKVKKDENQTSPNLQKEDYA